MKKVVRSLEGKLMFNSLLRAALMSYFLVCLSTIFVLRNPIFETTEDKIDFFVVVLLLIYLVAFPFVQNNFLMKRFGEIDKEKTKRYASLYENVNIEKKNSLRFTFNFCARRFAIAIIIVFLEDYIVFQIIAADIAVMAILSFYVAEKPMVDSFNNFIQIFNEVYICLALISLVLFTEFTQNPVDRYEIGYKFLYFVGFCIIVNVIMLFLIIAYSVYRAICKFLKKRELKKA